MFNKIFEFVMELEGGYKLHKNPTESTDTYAGIYRAAHPRWEGWIFIDEGENPPKDMVKAFYEDKFWDRLRVGNEVVQAMLYEYGVNAGTSKAIKILQEVVGVTADGAIGPMTRNAVAKFDAQTLVDKYTIAKIGMYTSLANNNPRKYNLYLRGWMNRALKSHKWFSVL